MKQNQPQIITGIVTNKIFQVPKVSRNELRQAVYYIDKFGLDSHIEKNNLQKANYVNHLIGLANYMLFINPKDKKVKEYKSKLLKYK